MDGFAFSYVNALLSRWGTWCEQHLDGDEGPPLASALGKFAEGDRSTPAHRILCYETPRRIWLTGYCVSRLQEPEREAITAWYVYHVKPDGTRWTAMEKAQALGISYETFRQRVCTGRTLLAVPLLAAC